MNRRGFLGSILGTVAGSNFFARLVSEPPQRVILPYRIAFREVGSGLMIQAPGVARIETIKNGYLFVAEPLLTTQTISLDMAALYDEHGRLIANQKFHRVVPMVCGDTLKCDYSLDTNIPTSLGLKELVAAFIRKQEQSHGIPG